MSNGKGIKQVSPTVKFFSEHAPALQEHDEDERHQEVMYEHEQGCGGEHGLAGLLQFREQLLVVHGDDRQRDRQQEEADGNCLEQECIVEHAKEQMAIVESQADQGQKSQPDEEARFSYHFGG